jgi:hypothetical protein
MRPGFINSFQPARDPPPPGLSIYDYFHSGSASGLTVSRFSRGTNAAFMQLGSTDPASGEVSATPFFVGSTGCRVDTLGVEAASLSTFVSLTAQVGIYDNAPFGANSIYPRNLLASGSLTWASSEVGLKRAAIGLDLTEGLYWLAFVVSFQSRSWTAPTPDGGRHPEEPFMGTVGGSGALSYYVSGAPTLPLTYPSGALVANFATSQSKRAPSFFLELS